MRAEISTTTQSSRKNKATSALKRATGKVIDVTSNILSAPARFKGEAQERKADSQYRQQKLINDHRGQPDAGNESDPLFRARVNAIHDTFDREEARQKQTAALQSRLKDRPLGDPMQERIDGGAKIKTINYDPNKGRGLQYQQGRKPGAKLI